MVCVSSGSRCAGNFGRDTGRQRRCPNLACSLLHQVSPLISKASERGMWMPQCAQRTMDSGWSTGGAAPRRGRESARGAEACLSCWRARMRATSNTARMTMAQKMSFPTLSSVQNDVDDEAAAAV
ncbi:hypothetical protein CSC67_00750 [Pusillimonas caeni]|nr:hypothetical protein CSC67_00750 [Pusillimonas caeni]